MITAIALKHILFAVKIELSLRSLKKKRIKGMAQLNRKYKERTLVNFRTGNAVKSHILMRQKTYSRRTWKLAGLGWKNNMESLVVMTPLLLKEILPLFSLWAREFSGTFLFGTVVSLLLLSLIRGEALDLVDC